MTLRARDAFVSSVGPKHLAAAFVEAVDQPRVFDVIGGQADAAIFRDECRLRVVADGGDHEDVVVPDDGAGVLEARNICLPEYVRCSLDVPGDRWFRSVGDTGRIWTTERWPVLRVCCYR